MRFQNHVLPFFSRTLSFEENSGPQQPVIPQQLSFAPYHASGIYDVGETVGWTVTPGPTPPTYAYKWTIRRNNAVVLKEGTLDLSSGKDTIAIQADQPEMLYVAIEAAADPSPSAVDPSDDGRTSSEATPDATRACTRSAQPSRRPRSGCRRHGLQTSTRSGRASSRLRRRFRSTPVLTPWRVPSLAWR